MTSSTTVSLSPVPGLDQQGRLAADPLDSDPVAAAQRVAADLAGAAAEVDRDGVTRAGLAGLAAAGLFGLGVPAELGGVPASEPVARRVAEVLSGACPQTWFVWFQHGPVARALGRSGNDELQRAWLARLCSGASLGGVAYSHLRGPRAGVTARPRVGGWVLTGRQPWCTGWGLHDVVLLGALTTSEEVLMALVPTGAAPREGMASQGELGLAAMGGTRTVGLRLEEVEVSDAEVVSLDPAAQWHATDRVKNANVTPSTFGVALAALALLAQRDQDTATALGARVAAVRAEAYRLLDEVPPEAEIPRRLALRAQGLALGMECATALLAATGGQGMGLASPAQRLLRAAAFQLVHAQDAAVRAATLAQLAQAG